jgi:hypothetical protein
MLESQTLISASSAGDFGWGDSDDGPRGLQGLGSAALVIASGLVAISMWFAGGLPPLAHLISRKRTRDPDYQ